MEVILRARLQILLVEDEIALRRALQRHLRAHRVLAVGSYDEANGVLLRQELDVVVSDNEMLGRSGLEVLQLCQRLRPGARRIMYSGHPPEDLPRYLEQGVIQHFVAKPAVEALLELIATLQAE